MLDTLRNTRGQGRTITDAEGMRGVEDRARFLWRNLQPGAVSMASEVKKAVSGERGYAGREYSLNEVASKTLGMRVRTVNIKEALPFTLRDFSNRWRKASAVATTESRRTTDAARQQDAVTYRDEKQSEIKRDFAQFRKDATLLGIDDSELEQAAKEVGLPLALRE